LARAPLCLYAVCATGEGLASLGRALARSSSRPRRARGDGWIRDRGRERARRRAAALGGDQSASDPRFRAFDGKLAKTDRSDAAAIAQFAEAIRPPSELHWLGTDQLGRDLFYRVMLGARTSLGITGAAVPMSLVLGLPIGMAAGFYRGGIDNALMRLVDTLLSFPVLLLALTISAMLGPSIPIGASR
jgi:ABC-type dipeptide/oligopeptide/nickel transport system permease subunit